MRFRSDHFVVIDLIPMALTNSAFVSSKHLSHWTTTYAVLYITLLLNGGSPTFGAFETLNLFSTRPNFASLEHYIFTFRAIHII